MLNALQTKALVSAVLITVLIQATLLLGLNELATEGASTRSSGIASAGAVVPSITLDPVTVVASRRANRASEVVRVASQHDECDASVLRVSANNDASVRAIAAC